MAGDISSTRCGVNAPVLVLVNVIVIVIVNGAFPLPCHLHRGHPQRGPVPTADLALVLQLVGAIAVKYTGLLGNAL